MKILIMSKEKASKFVSPYRYAIIGVVSGYDNHPDIPEGYVDRLKLHFCDIDIETIPLVQPITSSHASIILEFVEKYKDKVDFFVVHCNAGISRSSGIAAALSKIYNDDDSWVFKDRRYFPNMLVYRKILNAGIEKNLDKNITPE